MGPTVLYFLIWALFIFAMMRFGCGAHVMGHGHHRHHDSDSAGGATWTPPERDVDPVCRMTVETKAAKSSIYDGHVYYFCSQDCRQKFEDSPASYATGAVGAARAMEHGHEFHH